MLTSFAPFVPQPAHARTGSDAGAATTTAVLKGGWGLRIYQEHTRPVSHLFVWFFYHYYVSALSFLNPVSSGITFFITKATSTC